ncbi:DUF6265 family protein [Aequorivita capsosiphonis]|uniref:DUF6265 family protein n=1 Tax=Aequorivita capsosiphonis TaxID=487317 RepID=UPI000408F99F|nr:DUF6265 family protein [Aequorivita capsosiphonis]
MKKYILLILLPILIYSCKNNSDNESAERFVSNKKYEKIGQLEWLLGTWTNESGEEFSQETWSKENDSTFTAFSFTQVDGETVFAETMALEQKGERLLLTVATANEKGASPVAFRLIPSEEKQFTFENKSHDFPERITYTNPAKDSLHAWIEGTVNDQDKKVDFSFSRKN